VPRHQIPQPKLGANVRNKVSPIALSILLCAGLGTAQDVPQLERVLLPVTVRNAPGAFSTIWTTDLWVRIDTGGQNVLIAPLLPVTACDPPCPDGFGPVLAPYSYPIDFYRTHSGETTGSIIYVQRTLSDEVHFSLRLSNGRVNAIPAELPIVRERYFTSNTVHILGIPLTQTSRTLLRVYGIDPQVIGGVRVRVFSEDSGVTNTLLLDTILPLTVTQTTYTSGLGSFPLRPPFAQLAMNAAIGGTFTGVRVELAPVDPTLRIWGFASVTSNDSQEVKLRTPS
jgi:hypothetical protein